ncbi:N-acetylmuramoyl-L-alanine amidase [Paenibacillaceae bacterium]|nr:N-acetylmuramoyl-L-alanine amidase [Paenibacillaceae bacterium]
MKTTLNFILFDSHSEFAAWLASQKVSRKITMIQNHHTWLPNYTQFNGSNHFERLEAMRNFHMKSNGFAEVAQQLTTFPDGKIAYSQGRGFNIAPAGIKGANANGICIEHFGNFDIGGDNLTEEHRDTILFLNKALCNKFNLEISTEHVVYHAWWNSAGHCIYDLKTGAKKSGMSVKSCPGTNFFGGNTVVDAQKGFIPLIKSYSTSNNNKNNNNEESDEMKLSDNEWKMAKTALQNLYDKKVISDLNWIKKAEKKELTISELSWLNLILLSRK